MDRFGDDLTELILSFLAFEDKVMFEDMSKQWQRVIYNKQMGIEIWDENIFGAEPGEHNLPQMIKEESDRESSIDLKRLETLLKKCPNFITFSTDQHMGRELLELINKYCPRLKRLQVDSVSDECLEPSLWKFGQQLESFVTHISGNQKSNEKLEQLLGSFDNLKFLRITERQAFFKSNVWFPNRRDEGFLPKLETIDYCELNPKTMDTFKLLVDKYCKTLKTLIITVNVGKFGEQGLIELFSLIGRFDNLVRLTIGDRNYPEADFKMDDEEEDFAIPIDMDCKQFYQLFRTMFQKLSKLKSLGFSGEFVCTKFLKSLSECGSLEQLAFDFGENFDVRQWPVLPNLKVLKVECNTMVFTKRFATHIKSKMPKIQYLDFKCKYETLLISKGIYDLTEEAFDRDEDQDFGHIYVPLASIKSLCKVKHIGEESFWNVFYYGKYLKKFIGHPKLEMLKRKVGLMDIC